MRKELECFFAAQIRYNEGICRYMDDIELKLSKLAPEQERWLKALKNMEAK